MARPKTAGFSALGIVVLIIVAALQYYQSTKQKPPESGTPAKKEIAQSASAKKNGWTVYQNCPLIDHHNNDGDSFRIRAPDGSVAEYRLYFVDTPESTFKRYNDGNTNAERIAQQAKYFNGLSSEAATELGKNAKEFTLSLLKSVPFMVFTKQEKVYESGRFYCHVRLDFEGENRWLDEILVDQGFARIITQPADLPDGTTAETHRSLLRKRETAAKKRKVGGWQ